MSRSRASLRLPLGSAAAQRTAEGVAAGLGWEFESTGPGSLVIDEDATRLHCHCSPLRAHLTLRSLGADLTELRIDGRVPGWGPISSDHVRRQTDLLARRVGLAALDASRGQESGTGARAGSSPIA